MKKKKKKRYFCCYRYFKEGSVASPPPISRLLEKDGRVVLPKPEGWAHTEEEALEILREEKKEVVDSDRKSIIGQYLNVLATAEGYLGEDICWSIPIECDGNITKYLLWEVQKC